MRVVDLSGQTLGVWKVLARDDDGTGRAKWRCVCTKCGDTKSMYGTNLRVTASEAGCRKCHKRTEAFSFPSENANWLDMKTRVTNKNRSEYPRYSVLGMHEEWKTSFASFLAHIGPKPTSAHTIERIDNEVGYFPGNVRWATRKEQANNTVRNLRVVVAGKEMNLVEAAELLPVPYNTLRDWVHLKQFDKKVAELLSYF